MSDRSPDLSRIYNNVFGGSSIQSNFNGLVQKFKEGSSKGPQGDVMGCTWSGLTAIYDAVNTATAEDIIISGRRFKIVRGLGEGGYAYVYLVREVGGGALPLALPKYSDEGRQAGGRGEGADAARTRAARFVSPDGTYALKRFKIQTREQLQLVKAEIATARRFDHPNLLPLLEHEMVTTRSGAKEAYLLFPVFPDGTLQDHIAWMTSGEGRRGRRLPPSLILQILIQVASGLHHMHSCDPPIAHNDMKPGNVLISFAGGATPPPPSSPAPRPAPQPAPAAPVQRSAPPPPAPAQQRPPPPPQEDMATALFGPDFLSAAPAQAAPATSASAAAAGWVSDLEMGAGGRPTPSSAPPQPPFPFFPPPSPPPSPAVSVAIMDFGSATPARRQIRSRGQALDLQEWAAQHASAGYRAPEFFDCPSHIDIDERSDIWSLGCTLYALMYGLSPFERALGESGGSVQLAVMSGAVRFSSPSPYPPALHQLVEWMLRADLRQRPTAAEVAQRAQQVLATLPPDRRP